MTVVSQVLFGAKWTTAQEIALINCFKEEGQYICDFGEGAHIFFAEVSASHMKVTANHKEQTSP